MDLSVRPLTPQDFDSLEVLLAAAYGRPGEWRWELEHFYPIYPQGWFVAIIDGQIAGMGGATDYGPFAWVGLMGVDPSYQRRGVGHAVLEQLLAHLRERGCPIVVLDASAAGAPLYDRFHFEDDGATVLYRREADSASSRPSTGTAEGSETINGEGHERDASPMPRIPPKPSAGYPVGTPGPAHSLWSTRVTLLQSEDLPMLTRFDTPIFGADRSAVLKTFAGAFPERAFIARDVDGSVTGYLFAPPDRIGPWVAATPEDGRDLLVAALRLPYHAPPSVRVPSQNAAATGIIGEFGFTVQRSLRHMYLGPSAPEQNRTRIYSEASFGIG